MSTFAILYPERDKLQVSRVHLNIWLIPAPLHPDRYQVYFDVGLEFTIREAGDYEVELMLPLYGKQVATQDLSSQLLDANLASLIFSDSVTVNTRDRSLLIQGEKTSKMNLVASSVKRCDEDGDIKHRLSRWKLKLVGCTVGQSLYARHRFASFLPDTMVQVHGPLRSRFGIDVRVAEGREAMSQEPMKWASAKVLPIDDLYVFVIWPSDLAQLSNSPPFKYVRALEQHAWGKYLSNRGSRRRRSALVSYWRQSGPVTPEKPFRAHVVLQAPRQFLTVFYIAFLTYVIARLVIRPFDLEAWWTSATRWAMEEGNVAWPKAGIGLVLSALVFLFLFWSRLTENWKKFRELSVWMRKLLAFLDHRLFGGVRIE